MDLETAKRIYPAMWVIYEYPRDYPDKFVVRTWYGEFPTNEMSTHNTLNEARFLIMADLGGCSPLARSPNDDPCIVEVWL